MTIIYHDLASEYYLAYVLAGLMAEAPACHCQIRISKSEPPLLRGMTLPAKDASRMFALGLFQIQSPRGTKWFCIDAHDDSSPEGYFWPLLEKVDHYFKLNLNPATVESDVSLARHRAKIHPLGCAFALRPPKLLRFLPRLAPSKAYGWNWFSIKRRLLALQRNPDMQWHRKRRAELPAKDFFLVRRYYQEEGHARSNRECCQIFESIAQLPGLSGYMGFTGVTAETPECFRKHDFGRERLLREHLLNMARSRVCIYMPGTYNCLSFKFGQYLALGKPVIGMKLPFWPGFEMGSEDKSILEEQFCCDQPEEIAPKLLELLRDEKRQEFLKTNNIRLFERYFCPTVVASHILKRVCTFDHPAS